MMYKNNEQLDDTLNPAIYFNKLKEDINSNKTGRFNKKDLDEMENKAYKLLTTFYETGQIAAGKQIINEIKVIAKEKELLDLGYNVYLDKYEVFKYIENVEHRVVKVIELKNYPRVIPKEARKIIIETNDIFDDFIIVFTDYTNLADEIKKEDIEKDPILFGIFKDPSGKAHDRMYFLYDWVDEYCDLTLSTMIKEMEDIEMINPQKLISEDSIKDFNNFIDDINNELYKDSLNIIERVRKEDNINVKKDSIFKKIVNKIQSVLRG